MSSWQTKISHKTRKGNELNSFCPCCSGIKVCLSNCLATKNPEIAVQWHPSKNGNLKPSDYTEYSHFKAWWVCSYENDHDWQAPIADRSKYGCPCCAGKKVVLSNCLATKRPDIAKQWHPTKNNGKTPYDFTENSLFKAWWSCSAEYDHEWLATLNARITNGCPCCSGYKVALSNCLATKRPDIAAQWHPTKNGSLTPFNVTEHKGIIIWWICEYGHEWPAILSSRTSNEGCGCPECNQPGINHKLITQIFKENKIDYIGECRLSKFDPKETRKLRFDWGFPELNIAIEFDGKQHFKISGFSSDKEKNKINFEQTQERDAYKNKFCKEKNITLIRIDGRKFFNKKLENYILNEIIPQYLIKDK